MFLLPIIGFLLPWQTRFLLYVPEINGVVWDFGVLSIFISQIAIGCLLAIEFLKYRAELRQFVSEKISTRQGKIIGISFLLLVTEQIIFSANRLLTLQWIFGALLLFGLAFILHREKKQRVPFVAAFVISVVLQALLAALQIFVSGTFASTLLGMSAHKAVESGTVVIQYAGQRFLRAYGGQSHPNIFGGITLAALVLFNWLLTYKKTLGVRKNIIQYALLVTGALFFSFSRTAWIGFAIWIVMLMYQRKGFRESQTMMIRWTVGVFAILFVIFSPLVMTRVSVSNPLEQRSVSERSSELSTWKNVVKKSWFFGTGLGAYTARVDKTQQPVPVHSAPLLLVAELGIFGVLLVGFMIFTAKLRVSLRRVLPLIVIMPIALFDHYLLSLWAGQAVLFMFIFQAFEAGNDEG